MPRLGVLELPPILQERLVTHHDHVTLPVQVEQGLVFLAARLCLDGTAGVADLQLQGLLDVGVDRLAGNGLVPPWSRCVS